MMIIEIRKAGFTNKGAEMMLLSILDEVRKNYPDCEFVMAPTTEKGSQPFSKLTKLGIRTKFKLRRGRLDLSFLGGLIPTKIRNAYGIVIDKEVDVVLDASGFSYSDQWGEYDCMELNDSLLKAEKYKQKYILMPQAFGPFDNRNNIRFMKSILKKVDVVYARDKVSFQYLVNIEPDIKKIIQKPDFTCTLKPIKTERVELYRNKVPVVPNYRMLDKTEGSTSNNYLSMMTELVKKSVESGFEPYFLIHETHLDKEVANKINSKLEIELEMIEESNPQVIKGFLGVAKFVIASRYHASISALSQGVPVLGTSWSHKYEELFNEYDFNRGLVNTKNIKSSLIDEFKSDETYKKIVNKLIGKSNIVKAQTKDMWFNVFDIIDKG